MVTNVPLKVDTPIRDLLRCPICQTELTVMGQDLRCRNDHPFPVVQGVPVLLNEARSIFTIADVITLPSARAPSATRLKELASRLIPDINVNVTSRHNYIKLRRFLHRQSTAPRVLIVGGRLLGSGVEIIAADPGITLVETDIRGGPRTQIVCDGHDLPFVDAAFDAVIIQGVLGHVLDPYRCVEEIHRVLKADGLVYAETAFMQQVNAGAYDFTRFTDLGHRRLFRRFTEISSGAVCGTGMALAWAGQYFLYSLVRSRRGRLLARGVARLTLFWLPYLDYFLIHRPGTLDGASGYYFLGRKSTETLSDQALICLYRGIL